MTLGQHTIEEMDYRTMSDADIVAMNAFGNALRAESRPEDPARPLELTRASVKTLPETLRIWAWWIRDETGALIAEGNLSHHDTEDNKHLVDVGISVLPAHRRQGLGKALLTKVVEHAEQIKRPTIFSGTNERVPAGAEFAKKAGATAGLREHTNRLLIADLDRAMMDTWVAEGPGRAPGYTMIGIDGVYPDDMLEQIVSLHMVMNSAPRDDLDMEDWIITPEMVRDWERSMVATNEERWSLFIRHDESGQLVGFTEVGWNASMPKTVFQWGTGVRPEHRGYALGKWLKAAMAVRVIDARPDVVDIRTGNADSNDPMLGINTMMGFKPYISHTVWQTTVEQVRTYLNAGA